MTSSFKAFNRRTARIVLLSCLGISGFFGLVQPSLLGRPIEFSEPTGPTVSTNADTWAGQSTTGLKLESEQFKPNTLDLSRRTPNSLRPLPPTSARLRNRANPEKNWTQMSPDEMMQSMMHKDMLKLTPSGAGAGELNASSSVEDYYLHMLQNKTATNRLGAADSGGHSGETNLWDNSSGDLKASDPFAAITGRRSDNFLNENLGGGRADGWPGLLKSGEDMSPDAIRERKAQADQFEDYKRTFGFQAPGANPVPPEPAGAVRTANVLAPLAGSSFSSLPAKAIGSFTVPSAPLAPAAPFAPGQSSLAPAPYTAPAKPKSLIFSAPQRKF